MKKSKKFPLQHKMTIKAPASDVRAFLIGQLRAKLSDMEVSMGTPLTIIEREIEEKGKPGFSIEVWRSFSVPFPLPRGIKIIPRNAEEPTPE